MPEKKMKPQKKSLQTAFQFKEFCRVLIKAKIHTRADKEKLAEELNLTFGGVESFVYQGRGSFENYVAAICFLYEIDLSQLQSFLQHFQNRQRRVQGLRRSDQIWFELDEYYPEDHKEYLASLWRAAGQLNYKVTVKKMK